VPELAGNPHARHYAEADTSEDGYALAAAIMALAWEQRTANLIALREAQAADDPDIKARLGLADDPTTSPY
jgi:hypothetical protein